MDFSELQTAILAEHPEAAGNADDWTVVTALRAYTSAHVDYVFNVTSPYYSDQNGQPVEARFTTFERNAGGVVCGGTADALTELARAWGYSAWNLGIGDLSAGGFTHMQTLIAINLDGEEILTLHDPSTNLSYTDAAGAPLDYFAMLEGLAAGDSSDVALAEDRAAADNLVAAAETGDIVATAEASWTVVPAEYSVEEGADGWVVRSPRTLARFEEVISPWYGPFLTENGLPTDAVWLELFPHTIYGEGGDALLTRALAVVAGAGGRVGFEASEGFLVGDAGGAVNQRYLDAGYPVQTWYYGSITVVPAGDTQALQVGYVDGLGGDEEGIFELQGFTTHAVSARVTSTEQADVRVMVKDAAYSVIHEVSVASGSTFAWADPEARIWRLVVETGAGDTLVDDFAWGHAAAAPEVADDTGDTGGSEGTTDPPPDTDSTDSATAADSASEQKATAAEHPECGCSASRRGSAGWLLFSGLAALRRRRGAPTRGFRGDG